MSASNAVLPSSPSATSFKHDARIVLRDTTEVAGRLLLVTLFLISGIGKITAYAGTAAYMEAMGVPGVALPLVIALEVLGSVAIILGWQTRLVSVLLAGFTLATGVVFHNDFADQMQTIMFLKNLSIAGAFLMLAAHVPGRFSVDHRTAK